MPVDVARRWPRRAGVPVFFTTVVYDECGEAAAAVFLRKVPALRLCRPGTRWVEIDPRLGRPAPSRSSPRRTPPRSSASPFAAMLAGRDTLIVCGASTSGCVRATVVDAMQHGLCADRPARVRRGPLIRARTSRRSTDIDGRYGDVVRR